MEMSLLRVLGLTYHRGAQLREGIIKYFVVQRLRGVLFLGFINSGLGLSLVVCRVILLKLGLFPFHLWVVHIYRGLRIRLIIITRTLLKLPGLILLGDIRHHLLTLSARASILVGSMGGSNPGYWPELILLPGLICCQTFS